MARSARSRFLIVAFGCAAALTAVAQEPAPHAIDIPQWFANSFLDFPEEVADAARDHKRVMVYVGQDGCPYCTRLMAANFSRPTIVDKTRRHFVAIALNLWGDREVVWTNGERMTEKALARALDVQFTPTLLFLDERGGVTLRLDGYYPPQQFEAVLDYLTDGKQRGEALSLYLRRAAKEPASALMHDESFFMRPPYDLTRKPGAKPLAVVFETPDCAPCDELHREGFKRREVRALVASFDVARFTLGARTPVIVPDGRTLTMQEWARELEVAYTPSIVFFDASGREVFRIGAYLRPFHLASSFDYVASGAYRAEPSFQRYIQARADKLRGGGQSVELWR